MYAHVRVLVYIGRMDVVVVVRFCIKVLQHLRHCMIFCNLLVALLVKGTSLLGLRTDVALNVCGRRAAIPK